MSPVIKGSQGVFVIVVEEFSEPKEADNFTNQRNFLANSMKSRASREVYNALKDNSDIEDNRIMFY